MTELPKEGAGRPLYESAPKIAPAVPAAPYVWAALASYPLAWLYVKKLLFLNLFEGFWLLIFAVLFLAGVEVLARALHRPAGKETSLWAGGWLVLSVVMPLWGYQNTLSDWQMLVWHLFAVWFVLARCGMLAQGYTGSLCFLDALAGLLVLPFGNFFRRVGTIAAGIASLGRHRVRLRQTGVAAVTAALTLLLCGTAWGLLSAADPNFAAVGQQVQRWFATLLDGPTVVENLFVFLLSLPVGAWLYGLVAGALRRQTPPCTGERFYAALEPLRVLPAVTANTVVGALCAIYGLFFILQALEWLAAAPLGLTAPQASTFAVDGFWELLRILLLDFCVLAAVRFLGRRPLPRILAALFCLFGIAFAALAGAKLAVYVRLYAFTPRRVVAGWFLCVLAVWAVLLLVRVFRVIPAARVGLAVLAVSFVLLSCVDLESRVVQWNIGRYKAGVDAELDLDVLQDCGLNSWYRYDTSGWNRDGRVVRYTGWLIDSGWFRDRSAAEITELYDISGKTGAHKLTADLGQSELHLTFDDAWRCTAVSLTAEENGV
ncbi:MAG TPA: DUF4173 domain-containing protein [Candidatus Gemmiger excrementigallinarum]|uniref:DUF4173 domain-containing protein n=1 Tax=Candidatus Gemmiger excrementigallinarum TaxID=2838609 RepID=A0A9D2JAJ5_9FIRM|nr:DUF4173 domain-containing protein [Candidatus Gemmiger excrementigallinarum]